jgi:hypothetical protein
MKNKISFTKLIPYGTGWKFQVVRKNSPTRLYFPTEASRKRLQALLNAVGDNRLDIHVELGMTGWAEIEIYPKN